MGAENSPTEIGDWQGLRGLRWIGKSWTSCGRVALVDKLQVPGKVKVRERARTSLACRFATPLQMVLVLAVASNRAHHVYRPKRGLISVSIASPQVIETVTVRKGLEGSLEADVLSPTAWPHETGPGLS